MKNAILIHGMTRREKYYDPTSDNQSASHWLPWLQRQLLIRDVLAQAPEMPHPYEPSYDAWREVFERQHIDANVLLVGYSCGGGFLIRWLSENKRAKVGHVVLVAPWLDLERNHGSMFDFTIDPTLMERCERLSIVHSDDDKEPMQRTVALLRKTLSGYDYHEFHKHGHFCQKNLGTREFPELLNICLK
ncbi:MAG TPA: alpha/beta hydrolase [Candidatus Saccharimonadales bacterium]